MTFAALSKSKRVAPATARLGKGQSRGATRLVGSPFGFIGAAPRLGAAISPHPPSLQTKLKVGAPHDRFEQEADRVAEQVLRGDPVGPLSGDPRHLQRICVACEAEEKETLRRQVDEEKEEELQLKPDAGGTQAAGAEAAAAAVAQGGRPLSPAERAYFEPRFGRNFSDVRVHDEPGAHSAAEAINAQAYTLGTHVAFGRGEYQPQSQAGHRLLAHELIHVIQQSGLVEPRAPQQVIRRQTFVISACHPTARLPGDLDWPGTLEHLTIQQHYISNVNPAAVTEYAIPNSGPNGGTGYADIVDPNIGDIYEIKFHGVVERAIPEVLRYVRQADIHCPLPIPGASWAPGIFYPAVVLPFIGNQELVTWLSHAGVISYFARQRVPEPERQPEEQEERERRREREFEFEPVPEPVPIPAWVVAVIIAIVAIIVILILIASSEVWVPAFALILLILLATGSLSGEPVPPELAQAGIAEIPAIASFSGEHEAVLRSLRGAVTSPPSPSTVAAVLAAGSELHNELRVASATDPRSTTALHYSRQLESVIRQHV